MEAAQIYLACHVLSNDGGEPFQEILNELSAEERPIFDRYWKRRKYAGLAPADASAAREMLLMLIDRAVLHLEAKADALRQIAEVDAEHAVDRLRWDDTTEGEKLRRYDLACKRLWLRMSEMLLKARQNGERLDIGMIQAFGRSAPTVVAMKAEPVVSSDAIGMTPTEEPANSANPPSEANSQRRKVAERTQFGGEGSRRANPIRSERRSVPRGRSAGGSCVRTRRISSSSPARSDLTAIVRFYPISKAGSAAENSRFSTCRRSLASAESRIRGGRQQILGAGAIRLGEIVAHAIRVFAILVPSVNHDPR